jgi:hypothetical protein
MTKIDRTVIDPVASQPPDGDARTSVDEIKIGPGLRVEQYEIIRELGRGGMGKVFLARDNRLGRRVAMKFLLSSGKKFTDRFLVEARATAQCSHENIVVIHDVDQYLGLPYMVLEYVEGTGLGQLIAGKRLPAGRTIELMIPVVKALVRAHEANIVHRDLKPENIVVTAAGTVKVLDFGIAQLSQQRAPTGGIAGTLPYMSPEQLGMDGVDHRSDLWALGIILFEMLSGKHPLDPVTQGVLFGAAAALDEPMPSIADAVPGLPDKLVAIIAGCLAKKKDERYASAAELLADLEPLAPNRARALAQDQSPYPGLHAFQEADAGRFFGRANDVAAMVARLRDQPLVGVVGPSGVGKSSFVRAGVVPALKGSGEPWEAIVVRPGRQPLAALAGAMESLRDTRDSDPVLGDDAITRLRAEPGTLGARLRARARRKRCQILLFVDQHEELYTLASDPTERLAFTACLAGAADDASGPLRVVVSMRSDFLDRAAEDRRFVEELTRGLLFLQPPSRTGLEQALVAPIEVLGFGFEPGIVREMLEVLEATPGSLPLLQFTAAKLWETRDTTRRVLTRDSYLAMGGVAGALATHADEVLSAYSAADQKVVRSIFQHLVTPERTRAIVENAELRAIGPGVQGIVDHLVASRLLVVHTRGEGAAAVELVHESLIKSWPKLTRWLDESQEDASFLAQLRAAAKQWEQKGRVEGLLWRNEAHDEARLWRARYPHRELPPREQDFLDAVFALRTRAARRRRAIVTTVMVALILVIVAGAGALVKIRAAEQTAVDSAAAAELAKQHAQDESVQAAKQKAVAEQALADFKAEKDRADSETAAKVAETAKANAEAQRANAATQKAKIATMNAEESAAAARAAATKEKAAKAAAAKLVNEKAAKKAGKDGEIHTGGLK